MQTVSDKQNQVVASLSKILKARGISVSFQPPPDMPGTEGFIWFVRRPMLLHRLIGRKQKILAYMHVNTPVVYYFGKNEELASVLAHRMSSVIGRVVIEYSGQKFTPPDTASRWMRRHW